MDRRALIVLTFVMSLLMSAMPANASETVWIETEGYGFVNASNDTDSARRRALADALLNAALAGGAHVTGHTVVNMTRVERDLTIVRPIGRVLRHEFKGATLEGNMWRVQIRALVGAEAQTQCQSASRLTVIAYAPQIHVSPNAPAWANPLAQDIMQSLYGVLDRHPATSSLTVTDRPMPRGLTDAQAARDFVTLTRGDVRLTAGDWGFVPQLSIDSVPDGRNQTVEMRLQLVLISSDGQVTRQEVVRRSRIPGPSILGNAGAAFQPNRSQMMSDLLDGVSDSFDRLLDVQACTPLMGTVMASGGDLTVNLGRRQGISRGAIAYTADRDASIEMLEIVSLSDRSVTLRPMDPTRRASDFSGRAVRFIETGL